MTLRSIYPVTSSSLVLGGEYVDVSGLQIRIDAWMAEVGKRASVICICRPFIAVTQSVPKRCLRTLN